MSPSRVSDELELPVLGNDLGRARGPGTSIAQATSSPSIFGPGPLGRFALPNQLVTSSTSVLASSPDGLASSRWLSFEGERSSPRTGAPSPASRPRARSQANRGACGFFMAGGLLARSAWCSPSVSRPRRCCNRPDLDKSTERPLVCGRWREGPCDRPERRLSCIVNDGRSRSTASRNSHHPSLQETDTHATQALPSRPRGLRARRVRPAPP